MIEQRINSEVKPMKDPLGVSPSNNNNIFISFIKYTSITPPANSKANRGRWCEDGLRLNTIVEVKKRKSTIFTIKRGSHESNWNKKVEAANLDKRRLIAKGIREPHEVKKKTFFDLGRNRTHDLRIRSTVTLLTELRGRTEKVGDGDSPPHRLRLSLFYSDHVAQSAE